MLFVLLTSTAWAKPKKSQKQVTTAAVTSEAGEQLSEGLQHYEAGEYESARASFQKGYKLDPKPDFLFALGQAERLSGDCPSAIIFYQKFLETEPAQLHANLAAQMIEKCEVALGSSPEERLALEAKARSEQHAATPILQVGPATTILMDYEPWHRDAAGVTLLSTSAAALLAGGSFLLSARASSSQAESANTYQEHAALLARADRHQRFGAIGLAAGGALLTSCALYYLLRDPPKHIRNIEVTSAGDRASASLQFAF